MRLYDSSPTVNFDVISAASGSTIIYVGEVQDLKVTLTNSTGSDIKFQDSGAVSYFEIVLPGFYTTQEIQNMSVTDLQGWGSQATDYTLLIRIAPGAGLKWANGDAIHFTIKGAKTDSETDPDDISINFYNMTGDNIPSGPHVTLTPAPAPVDGKADLSDVLHISLDNQGIVFVSPGYNDPLANTLYLNIKNIGKDELFTGSAASGRNRNAKVTISFLGGNTAGALAPEPYLEKIACEPYVFPPGYDWGVQRDDANPSGWKLSPANTNTHLLGTGANANVSFKLGNIVTANPAGYTQIVLRFSGFSKDDNKDYNDFVYILDIIKQPPPPTRGLLSFYSRTALLTVGRPGLPVSFQLNWSMLFVDKVTVLTSYPGMQPHSQNYTSGVALAYDTYTITIPSVAQSMPVFVTIMAFDGANNVLNSMQFSVFIQSTAFVDTRDNQVYPVVQIGQQFWMAKNLDYVVNGQSFVLNDSPANEPKYGRLYYQQIATQNLPDGWRLPTIDDWKKLLQLYGSPENAYKALSPSGNSGFNAQLGGYMDNLKSYADDGNGNYWTSTQQDAQNICYAKLDSTRGKLNLLNTVPPNFALSIRYVKDL